MVELLAIHSLIFTFCILYLTCECSDIFNNLYSWMYSIDLLMFYIGERELIKKCFDWNWKKENYCIEIMYVYTRA